MKPIVVKLGGSLLENAELRATALESIAAAWKRGTDIVVVHGGGKAIDAKLALLGIPKRSHRGLRITDAETLDLVVSVLAGSVNKSLVAELHTHGVSAAGISGADGETLIAELHPPLDGIDLGFVGSVTGANTLLLESITSLGFLPVVSSIAISEAGSLLNVNADTAAAELAVALSAERLVFLTDVEGLLSPEGTVIHSLTADEASRLVSTDHVTGGMQPKLRASAAAVSRGVGEVVIAGPSLHASALSHGKGGTHLVAA